MTRPPPIRRRASKSHREDDDGDGEWAVGQEPPLLNGAGSASDARPRRPRGLPAMVPGMISAAGRPSGPARTPAPTASGRARELPRGRHHAGGPPHPAAARGGPRSGGAHDRCASHPHGRRSRLPARRPRRSRRQAGSAGQLPAQGTRRAAGLRSARRLRARSRRVPGATAQGSKPLRSADRPPTRQPCSARQPQSRRR